jgi:hypothetical protein
MKTKSLIIGELPFSVECMIENALLDSILNTTSKQIEQPWRVPQDDNRFDPLHGLLGIRKLGTLQKNKVDNTNEWAAWHSANENTKQQGPFIAKQRPR